METFKSKEDKPEAILYTLDLDTGLIQTLSKYWVVVVEQRENDIQLELYKK